MLAALLAAAARARTPPLAPDPREGVWLGAGEAVVHQALDRWSVFEGGATVNRLAADGSLVWIATDDGVIRLDTGSRRVSRLGMADGLPSQAVAAVAVDDAFVWFGTNKGLARYRKLDRTVRVFGEADGLPHAAVNDVLVVGRQVWLATRAGIALYDPDVDGVRGLAAAQGFLAEDVAELWAVGDEIWGRTERGLSRLRPKARSFTHFGRDEIGGAEIRAFAQDGERIWIGTENGLVGFEPSGDAFVPFPQQEALAGRAIVGVEPFTDYLFIATDRELVQWHKARRTLRVFGAADGLARSEGARGTALYGGQLVLLFADGAEVYDIQRDRWSSRGLAVTEGGRGASAWRAWMRADAFQPYDLRQRQAAEGRYADVEAGAGLGLALPGGRSFDGAFRVDYGQLDLPGVRDVDASLEYLGRESDVLREVRAGDALLYESVEEGLERAVPLLGAHARVASPGPAPGLQATADAGVRRGLSARDFLVGPRREVYQLSRRYVLPGSERVTVDGETLAAGTDYTLVNSSGQLAFLDPERVDDLSIVEVDYEYDLLPKKGLGVLSILDYLPADEEVGAWVRSGTPRLVSEESGLYAQIDGAAPKYIDRGWEESVFAEYRQAGRSLQVAVHDMGTEAHARDLFSFDLPPAREPVGGRDDVVLDIGLASSYAVKAVSGSFYFELSIDEKSDAAKQSIRIFALQVLDRAEGAGENRVPGPRPVLAAARVAISPGAGLEVGARVLQQTEGPEGVPGLRSAGLDGRWERPLGGGRLTAYAEAAGTEGIEDGAETGAGAMARLRISHRLVEGVASGRWQSPGYLSLTSRQTLFGELRSEGTVQATAYPAPWLPATVFFTRQLSEADGGGQGTVQHALARVQLAGEGLPASSVQVGHSLLDGPDGAETERVRIVGQTDYDLAQGPLAALGLRRLALRALYGVSDATSREDGAFARAVRAEQLRLEARVAPTADESGYVLFRGRRSTLRPAGGAWALGVEHWELTAGARSASLPGLVPSLSYSVVSDDDRVSGALPVQTVRGTFGAELQVFPGRWAKPLAPVLLDVRYSLSADDRTEGGLRTLGRRVHRVDNRFLWSGTSRLELELYQVLELPRAGAEGRSDGRRLELGNRAVFRPVPISPLTLRLDYLELRAPNDRTLAAGAPAFGLVRSWDGAAEWLMRWTRAVTTRLKADWARAETGDTLAAGDGGVPALRDFVQYRTGPELELRVLLAGADRSLYLVQRDRLYRLFGAGAGAVVGDGLEASLGVIWTVGDALYLDGEVAYRQLDCDGGPCQPVSALEPRLLFSGRL